MKNMAVQWHGGGYGGCLWEPNIGFFDQAGDWHPVVSTGRFGLDEEDSVKEYLKTPDDFRGTPIRVKLIPDPGERIQANIRDDFAMTCLTAIAEAGYQVSFRCWNCGERVPVDQWAQRFHSYRGDGGIGIIQSGPICYDCESRYTCDTCNTYAGTDFMEKGLWGKLAGRLCCSCASDVVTPEEDEAILKELEQRKIGVKALYKGAKGRFSKSWLHLVLCRLRWQEIQVNSRILEENKINLDGRLPLWWWPAKEALMKEKTEPWMPGLEPNM